MDKMCRCCVKNQTGLKVISDEEKDTFQNCTGLMTYRTDDGLPQSCCQLCWRQINQYSKFRQECHKADIFLRSLTAAQDLPNLPNENMIIFDLECEDFKSEVLDGVNTKTTTVDAAVKIEKHISATAATFKILPVQDTKLTHQKKNSNFKLPEDKSHLKKCSSYMEKVYHDENSQNHDTEVNTENGITEQTLFCDKCAAKFESIKEYQLHYRQSHKNKFNLFPYRCELCGHKFTRNLNLETHLKNSHIHVKKTFTCELTQIHNFATDSIGNKIDKFKDKKNSENLTDSNASPHKIKCDLCDKKLKSKIHLKYHFVGYHLRLSNISHKCDICRKQFRLGESVRQHTKITHSFCNNANVCKICGLRFVRNSLLIKHTMVYKHIFRNPDGKFMQKIESHLNYRMKRISQRSDYKIKCEFCTKILSTKTSLTKHIRQIHPESILTNAKIECLVCKKNFSNYNLHKIHMKKYHQKIYDEGNRVECKICNKKYTKQSLKNHLKTHEARRNDIQCAECGRTFFSLSTYSYHQKTHSDEKPFKCSDCPKAFYTKYQVDMHALTHSNTKRPKRFSCNLCGKGCASTSELTVHLRTHTKERPFKCTQCEKGFLTKSHLRNHMVTHTGEKNYKCKENGCKSFYSSVSSLKKHYYTVHCPDDQKNFQCDLCFKKFGQKTFLNQHRKAHGKIAKV